MDQRTLYGVNYPNVVAEPFDGEWVIVNLDTGTYFSMDGSAGVLWPYAVAGLTLDDFIDQAARIFPTAGSQVRQDAKEFHQQLREHSLIRPIEAEQFNEVQMTVSVVEYAPPRMSVHADLQDILLLDPVHDVDAAGWPVTAPLNDESSPRSDI